LLALMGPAMMGTRFKWICGGVHDRDSGFTLLEVLVAFAIAVPVLALMYRQGVLSLGITQSSVTYQEAISRVRSRLDALVDTAVVAGDQEGDDGGGYWWRTRIVPVATTPAPRAPPRDSPFARGTTLYSVQVQIAWASPRGTQRLTVDTRRLGPASAGGR